MRDSNSLHCLLDDDADAVRLARRRRVRSLAVSIALQALFITTVIVAPLLATGKLQLQTRWEPPVIVYRGTPSDYRPEVRPSGSQRPTAGTSWLNTARPIVQPDRVPDTIGQFADEGAAGPSGQLPYCPGCRPDGVVDPSFALANPHGPQPPMPEQPQPAPVQRVVRGGSVQEAMLVNKVTPQYPPLCRQMRLEGEIVLRAIISREGTVQELAYVSGPACFLQFSMNAVAQWRYRPTLLNGQPVEVETTIRVVFRLNR